MPAPIQLSQHILTDFVECPRRYYLRNIAHQQWPLIETGPGGMPPEEYRGYLQRGVQLHRAIERNLLGIEQTPDLSAAHADVRLWWGRFAATDLSALPAQRATELALIAPLGDASLYVRYDLLAWDDDAAVIVDWKTIRAERPPSQAWFRDRLQTRAYLYALCAAGAALRGAPFEPAQVRMRYWLANFPDRPWVDVRYSQAAFDADHTRLHALAHDISTRTGIDAFELTANERHCTYCSYRTLFARAGQPSDAPHDDVEVAEGEIPELEY